MGPHEITDKMEQYREVAHTGMSKLLEGTLDEMERDLKNTCQYWCIMTTYAMKALPAKKKK